METRSAAQNGHAGNSAEVKGGSGPSIDGAERKSLKPEQRSTVVSGYGQLVAWGRAVCFRGIHAKIRDGRTESERGAIGRGAVESVEIRTVVSIDPPVAWVAIGQAHLDPGIGQAEAYAIG